jgi:hypothetical protein
VTLSRKASGSNWRLAFVIVGVLVPADIASGQESLAIAVKAAYLYKMAPFVDWPKAAMGGPRDPLVICVVGPDPFGLVLDRAIAGAAVDGHPIVAHRQSRPSPTGCHIAFLGWTSGPRLKEGLRAFQDAPVLTVTDDATPRGIVDFTLRQGRVRFRIDPAEASRSGLSISSKLLGLAVTEGAPPVAGVRP